MNKEDLVKRVAQKADVSQNTALDCINATMESVTESLTNGEKVTLVGFGTFDVRQRAARKGVNPQTKKKIKIPAKTVPVFKPGKNLKERV